MGFVMCIENIKIFFKIVHKNIFIDKNGWLLLKFHKQTKSLANILLFCTLFRLLSSIMRNFPDKRGVSVKSMAKYFKILWMYSRKEKMKLFLSITLLTTIIMYGKIKSQQFVSRVTMLPLIKMGRMKSEVIYSVLELKNWKMAKFGTNVKFYRHNEHTKTLFFSLIGLVFGTRHNCKYGFLNFRVKT